MLAVISRSQFLRTGEILAMGEIGYLSPYLFSEGIRKSYKNG